MGLILSIDLHPNKNTKLLPTKTLSNIPMNLESYSTLKNNLDAQLLKNLQQNENFDLSN
jgi:hypothetical protein